MSLPTYSEYKDSRVSWLGRVPAHWEVKPLKHNLRLLTAKTDRRINPVALENIESWSGRFVATESEFQGEGIAFERNDILFGKLRPYLAKVLVTSAAGEAVGDFLVMRPNITFQSKFAQYSMLNQSFIEIVDGSTFGSKMPRASWDFVSSIALPTPPIAEQAIIATFLDRETAKIDALIAEQEKLIALLAEKRQATISHVVTRGLNPDVPMKDSGVAWLGKVPAHWKVLAAKRIATVFVPQRNKPEINEVGNGICWATMENVKQAFLTATSCWVSENARVNAGSRVLAAGAVIASCVGNFNVATINTVDVIINQQLQAFIPSAAINPEYLRYVVLISQPYFELIGTAATLAYVNQQGFENLPIPLPPPSEQNQILEALNCELEIFDRIADDSTYAIQLLKERRNALITAAVTGQIDVRDSAAKIGVEEKTEAI
ncbi:hypothetical protein PuT2_03685 [Pusillimonas sp. T2]|uniref:restriction endonuclease subunit S n=1 Tax=Pusillimonas sp. T2 TaxID=1548123 RepID=UPI000B946578|nr:restriction endonuclease subunit S [Pusillimonas sp. T2]OXR49893.1 hypothetical protein PuT2_03685 [Pusillimonas sp. T2]